MTSVLLLVLPAALVQVVCSQTHVFYPVAEARSWAEAQTFCRQHYMDLATMEGPADQEELVRVLPSSSGLIWIGLWRWDANALWFWSDRSDSTFMPWGAGQPNNYHNNQYCGAMVPDGTLNDQNCLSALPFICQNERMKHTLRLTVTSGHDLNAPDLLTDLLMKIQELMKENGLKSVSRMNWTVQPDGHVFQDRDHT